MEVQIKIKDKSKKKKVSMKNGRGKNWKDGRFVIVDRGSGRTGLSIDTSKH